MELSFSFFVKTLTLLTVGLSAGLFFAWSVSVILGTKSISDHSYVEAMQSINRAILNPVFFIVFFGAFLLLVLSCFLKYQQAVDYSFWLVLTATVLYGAGTLGVTIWGNVPLNNMLDAVAEGASTTELAQARLEFEHPWNQLHQIRTWTSGSAFILLILAYL